VKLIPPLILIAVEIEKIPDATEPA